jgi:prolyl oligopeptidase
MKKYCFLAISTLTLAVSVAFGATTEKFDYPQTKKVDQVDDYFGTKIADPYRWLEDDNAADTKAWVQAENRVTFGYLDKIEYRSQVRDRLKSLVNYARYSAPAQRNGDLYYTKNDGLQNQGVLYVDKGAAGHPEVLLDPNTFSPDGTIRLSNFQIDKAGHYAVWAQTAIPGSDWDDIHVMDLQTRKPLEVLHWNKYSEAVGFQGDGFYYQRLPVPAAGSELTAPSINMKVYFHHIGDDQAKDQLVYETPDHPTWFPGISTTEDERFAILSVEDPSKNGNSILVRDESKHETAFVPVVGEISDDKYDVIDDDGDDLIIKTNHDAPNYSIQRYHLNATSGSRWQNLIAERPEPIDAAGYVGDRLFVTYLKDVAHKVEIFKRDGTSDGDVALPGLGTAGGFAGRHDDRSVYYSYTSMNYPNTIFRYDLSSRSSSVFQAPVVPGFKPEDYVVKQVFFKSKDGTKIPMFISYKRGIKLDGKNPTKLYGYGGFDITMNPYFSAFNIAWLEQGGVFAMVNLRGGGEYGEKWHLAGMRYNKQNVFDDCIAAAKYLIAEKYTSPKRLALEGGSNGGLLVGAVVNQRPDLFQVALPEVGVMDMLRFQHFSAGIGWVSDYGSSDNEKDFHNLIKYSPLHNIKDGVNYPAMMVITSDHDDRVVPAHSFKYIATMQAKKTGPAPHLIRIETNSGHGASNLSKRIEEAADTMSFAWSNMGVTPHYPVAGQ